MNNNNSKKLGQLLLDFNYIDEEQLEAAISEQRDSEKRLGQIMVDLDLIEPDELVEVLEFQLGISKVDLSDSMLNPHLSQYVPENIARRYNVVPIERDGETLKVAMSDPSDLIAIDDIEMTSGLKVKPYIATIKDIRKATSEIYSVNEHDASEVFDSLTDFETTNNQPEIEELREMVEDAPIVRLTRMIINQAVQMRASDIHIEPQVNDVRVRYRVDGVLREDMTAPKYTQAALISRLKIMADLDITQSRVPQDGRVRVNVKGMEVDMRVSTLPIIHGEKVVIRLLNRDESLLNIRNLGFNEYNLDSFQSLISKPHGILLATGPTGSGKSTTLFAALNRLNTPGKNIVTIEDPVEYQIPGINQVQARSKTGLTFARTLRSILRQDPDIIMVGEIRDEETAEIAVRAALTGHLVLSTLHTNDSVSSITRLIDMGIPPYLVASTVVGVIAQRLVRRLCKDCKKAYEPGAEEREFLGEDVSVLYRAESCSKCSKTGYRGRLAVQEVLVVDNDIEELVVRNEDERTIKNKAIDKGMITLSEDGKDKVIQGITSYQEMARLII